MNEGEISVCFDDIICKKGLHIIFVVNYMKQMNKTFHSTI